jgi:hypothetical protein
VIGHLIRAYETGRDDAKHGLPRRTTSSWAYAQGYADELASMARERRLAQLRLWEAV